MTAVSDRRRPTAARPRGGEDGVASAPGPFRTNGSRRRERRHRDPDADAARSRGRLVEHLGLRLQGEAGAANAAGCPICGSRPSRRRSSRSDGARSRSASPWPRPTSPTATPGSSPSARSSWPTRSSAPSGRSATRTGPVTVWGVLAELALCVVVVACTGLLGVPVRLLPDDRGDRRGLRPGLHVRHQLRSRGCGRRRDPLPAWRRPDDQALRRSAQWAFLLLLVAMVAGYARRIFTESERQQSLALDRLGPARPRPTSCSSRSTGSPSRCRRRSTSTTSSTPR